MRLSSPACPTLRPQKPGPERPSFSQQPQHLNGLGRGPAGSYCSCSCLPKTRKRPNHTWGAHGIRREAGQRLTGEQESHSGLKIPFRLQTWEPSGRWRTLPEEALA